MNEPQRKRKMRRLPEIAYASECKNLSVTPNEVEKQILSRALSSKGKERCTKMIRRFIESINTSNNDERVLI